VQVGESDNRVTPFAPAESEPAQRRGLRRAGASSDDE